MNKFWNWVKNEGGDRALHLEGVIASDTWWGDEVTPKMFKDDLDAGDGNVTVWINSPGGDVFAGAQIYNMLCDYAGKVIVKIDGIAASAASVIAMAGDEVCMSPVSMMMIHNPSTLAWGDSEEMLRAKKMLDEVKESIINAYEIRTKLSRTKLAKLMDEETWMSAQKAVDLGFADKVLFSQDESGETTPQDKIVGFSFSRMAVTNSLLTKFSAAKPAEPAQPEEPAEPTQTTPSAECAKCKEREEQLKVLAASAAPLADVPEQPTGTPIESLEKRLELIKNISKI